VATDSTVVAGLEGLIGVANENEIPVIASDPSSGARGTVLAQGLDYYQEGIDAGLIALAYLDGETDIAETGISRQTGTSLVVNLDAAAAQNVDVPESLLEQAGTVIEDGEAMSNTEMPMGEALLENREMFLEGLQCTPERIEEQQAELDAADAE